MVKKRWHKLGLGLLLVVVVLGLAGCDSSDSETKPEPSPTAEEIVDGKVLVIGAISDDPIDTIEELQSLADYLLANLSDAGVADVTIEVVTSMPEMTDALQSGEVDLLFDSVYPSAVMLETSGARPILRRWKNGVAEYHTVIITSIDSGIESIDDLQGSIITFEEDFSTSGFALPIEYLSGQGYTLQEYASFSVEDVPDDQIGFVFSGEDENTLQWVASGQVAAGALGNSDLPDDSAQFVVLAETDSVPRQITLVGPVLDDSLVDAIKSILLGAHEDPAGQAALETFGKTSKFDEFPEGLDEFTVRMNNIRETIRQIRGQ